MTIAVIVGSLRQGSFNQAVADLAINSAPEGFELKQLSIAEIPFFNKDLEDQVPEAVTTFAEAVAQADAVLIVTPEYNRSIPGILKNAIDWLSRPSTGAVWTGKPIGIMGASDGQFGTQTAQFDLRRILTHTGAMIMPQPQVYVAKAQEKLNQGKFDEATIKVVGRYMQALAKWTERNAQDK